MIVVSTKHSRSVLTAHLGEQNVECTLSRGYLLVKRAKVVVHLNKQSGMKMNSIIRSKDVQKHRDCLLLIHVSPILAVNVGRPRNHQLPDSAKQAIGEADRINRYTSCPRIETDQRFCIYRVGIEHRRSSDE